MDEAQELALIRSVLVETFPEQIRLVGKTNLNDIVQRRGQVRIVPIPGSRLDWTEALVLLAHGALAVSQWLAVRAKADVHVHVGRVEHVKQDVHVGSVQEGSQVSVTGIEFQVPPELADRLDPATIDRLVSSFLAHLEAMDGQGSSPGERE
ncbi:MAG TPA: hypothetical protein VF142_01290 [Longimicrobium sp.]